jgi:hypothetical protein
MMTAIKAEILSYLEAVRGTDAELYPVYEFVAAHGDEAKDALWSLWRDKAAWWRSVTTATRRRSSWTPAWKA